VEVTSRVEHPYQGNDDKIGIRIQIDEGAQWTVAKLSLNGVAPNHEEAVRGVLQSGEGQPFSDLNAAIDRESILDYYYNEGYPDATFQWSFKPASAPHQVELTYVVEEGGRKFVREILTSGLAATNPALVDERIALKEGDPLSRNKMLETQRLLYNLGIFSRVDMALQNPSGDEERKYVLLQMEESNKYTVTGGLGAEIAKIGGSQTTLDEPAGTTGFSPRVNFEVTRRNFLGDGHIVSLKTRASTLQRRAVLGRELAHPQRPAVRLAPGRGPGQLVAHPGLAGGVVRGRHGVVALDPLLHPGFHPVGGRDRRRRGARPGDAGRPPVRPDEDQGPAPAHRPV
jgi:outer membrane protein assembly factor BamA